MVHIVICKFSLVIAVFSVTSLFDGTIIIDFVVYFYNFIIYIFQRIVFFLNNTGTFSSPLHTQKNEHQSLRWIEVSDRGGASWEAGYMQQSLSLFQALGLQTSRIAQPHEFIEPPGSIILELQTLNVALNISPASASSVLESGTEFLKKTFEFLKMLVLLIFFLNLVSEPNMPHSLQLV